MGGERVIKKKQKQNQQFHFVHSPATVPQLPLYFPIFLVFVWPNARETVHASGLAHAVS